MIINPYEPDDSKEDIERLELNRKRYETEPELQQLADKIHISRMLAPPACDQCICMAIHQLEQRKK